VVYRRASIDEILPLRHAILRPGLPPASADFAGDREPTTRHFAATLGGRVIGCLSLMLKPLEDRPAYQLRGMAIEVSCQRAGIGAALLEYALRQVALEDGPRLFWCNARTGAVEFYVKQGWRIISDQFTIEGVGPHFRLALDLLARPDAHSSTAMA
jgi:GNAT superfamily N-acetyltransferase